MFSLFHFIRILFLSIYVSILLFAVRVGLRSKMDYRDDEIPVYAGISLRRFVVWHGFG